VSEAVTVDPEAAPVVPFVVPVVPVDPVDGEGTPGQTPDGAGKQPAPTS